MMDTVHNAEQGQPPRAEFWERAGDGGAVCGLCPHQCRIREGGAGLCRVRGVRGGELRAIGYGAISSAHIDPVEKKPLYHFHPGESIFSIGGWGCNLGCVFCQNWSISQRVPAALDRVAAGDVVAKLRASGCRLIAYTYNEPLVGFEFVRDCCRLVREAGMKNVLVTNGYMNAGPASGLLPLVDALNVDIKSMEDSFYRRECHATLGPVLDFCKQAVKAGCHIEITNLVVPTLNDAPELFARLSAWIREELGENIPLHLSAYRPEFKATWPPTPPETLMKARQICGEHLRYVYVGNVWSQEGQDTLCPGCGSIQIGRKGYATTTAGLRGSACRRCGRPADIVVS